MYKVQNIKVVRIYDNVPFDNSIRILIDRLWPRGISKEKADIDHWYKELAPSHDLRKWYDHDHAKWEEFQNRYAQELTMNEARVIELLECVKGKEITLLFASRELEKNNAVAFRSYLEKLLDQ